MATHHSKLRLEKRNRLESVLPLSTPYSIYLDPASACNFKCSFCPTGHRDLTKHSYKRSIMPLELFSDIIGQFSNFPNRIRVLRLNKIGEPMLNKNLPEMISIAKKSRRVEWIDFATNGSLFNESNIQKIVESGVNRINISLEGLDSESYLENAKVKIDFAELVSNLTSLFQVKKKMLEKTKEAPEILIKIPRQLLRSRLDEDRFWSIFDAIADITFIENLVDIWPDFDVIARSGKPKQEGLGQYQAPVKPKKVCSVITYSMTINSDGTVSACCSDWDQKLLLGDLKKDNLTEVWYNKQHLSLIKAHLSGKRNSLPVCATCGHVNEAQVDDIDDSAKVIEDKFSARISGYTPVK